MNLAAIPLLALPILALTSCGSTASNRPTVSATAPVILAFVGVPRMNSATFWVSCQRQYPDGQFYWPENPGILTVRIGDHLCGSALLSFTHLASDQVDLTTPYTLTAIRVGVRRSHFVITTVLRSLLQNADHSKDFDLKVVEKSGDVMVADLTDPATGATLSLPIFEPAYDKPYPHHPGPAERYLHDAPPTRWHADTGPLEQLRIATNDDLMRTDTDYFTWDDGQVFWREPTNHKLRTYPEPGSAPLPTAP